MYFQGKIHSPWIQTPLPVCENSELLNSYFKQKQKSSTSTNPGRCRKRLDKSKIIIIFFLCVGWTLVVRVACGRKLWFEAPGDGTLQTPHGPAMYAPYTPCITIKA